MDAKQRTLCRLCVNHRPRASKLGDLCDVSGRTCRDERKRVVQEETLKFTECGPDAKRFEKLPNGRL